MNRVLQELLDACFKYYNERKILIWGSGKLSEVLETELIKGGINVSGRIDSNPALVDEVKVFKTEILNGRRNEFFVIVPVGRYPDIRNCLKKTDLVQMLTIFTLPIALSKKIHITTKINTEILLKGITKM